MLCTYTVYSLLVVRVDYYYNERGGVRGGKIVGLVKMRELGVVLVIGYTVNSLHVVQH